VVASNPTPRAAGVAASRARTQQDTRIVNRIARHDAGALTELHDRYLRRAYSLARRICVDEVLAEDVVQEVFLKLWADPARYRPHRGAFASWLLTVVHHQAVDAVRREDVHRRRQVVLDDTTTEHFTSHHTGADHDAIGNVVGENVRQAITALPAMQARTIMLAYYGGYTHSEIATILGVPLGTVKSRMVTAARRLRSTLSPLAGDFGIIATQNR